MLPRNWLLDRGPVGSSRKATPALPRWLSPPPRLRRLVILAKENGQRSNRSHPRPHVTGTAARSCIAKPALCGAKSDTEGDDHNKWRKTSRGLDQGLCLGESWLRGPLDNIRPRRGRAEEGAQRQVTRALYRCTLPHLKCKSKVSKATLPSPPCRATLQT